MGCWNGTCNISNMPIFSGDKVVLIPLMKIHEKTVFNACYPTDNFIPLGLPIVGYYNDYGGLCNIEISDVNRDYFKSLNFYFANNHEDNDEKYREVKDYDNFEDFVNDVLCSTEGCFVDIKNMDTIQLEVLTDNKAEINFMMVHCDLYDVLMDNMRNRIPYDHSETLETLLNNKFNFVFTDKLDKLQRAKSAILSDDGNYHEGSRILFEMYIHNLSNEIFNKSDFFFAERWNYFVNKMIDDENVRKDLIKCAVDKHIFMIVLSRLRKGYLCDSGCGSQSEETKLHFILADFIKNQIIHNANNRKKPKNNDGFEEVIYF